MKRYLVYMGSGIGDALIVSPLAKALKELHPDCEVYALICKKSGSLGINRDALSLPGCWDGVESYSKSELAHSIAMVVRLRNRGYEAGFIAQYQYGNVSLWPHRIMRAAGIKTYCVRTDNLGSYGEKTVEPPVGRYRALPLLNLLSLAEGKDVEPLESLFPVLRKGDFLRELVEELPLLPYVALCVGGSALAQVDGRAWPISRWIELANELICIGCFVVLLGGSEEEAALDEEREIRLSAGAINLCGKLRLRQSVAAIANSSLVVSADSGLLHCATALNAPVVALFGSTDPAECVPPFSDAKILLGSCNQAPCFHSALYRECKDRKCMENISVASVVKAIEERMSNDYEVRVGV